MYIPKEWAKTETALPQTVFEEVGRLGTGSRPVSGEATQYSIGVIPEPSTSAKRPSWS